MPALRPSTIQTARRKAGEPFSTAAAVASQPQPAVAQAAPSGAGGGALRWTIS